MMARAKNNGGVASSTASLISCSTLSFSLQHHPFNQMYVWDRHQAVQYMHAPVFKILAPVVLARCSLPVVFLEPSPMSKRVPGRPPSLSFLPSSPQRAPTVTQCPESPHTQAKLVDACVLVHLITGCYPTRCVYVEGSPASDSQEAITNHYNCK